MFEPSDHTRKHLRSNFQVPATPDFITTFLVIADIIKACRPAKDNSVPDRESQTQSSLASNKLDDMNLTGSSPPPSETASSSESCSSKSHSIHSSTPSSSSQSTQSEDDNEDDPSNTKVILI